MTTKNKTINQLKVQRRGRNYLRKDRYYLLLVRTWESVPQVQLEKPQTSRKPFEREREREREREDLKEKVRAEAEEVSLLIIIMAI